MGSLRHTAEVRAGAKDFSTGLLNDLLAALRDLADGDLLSLHGPARLGPDLDRWARFTGNAIVEVTPEGETSRFLVRTGAPRSYEEAPVGGPPPRHPGLASGSSSSPAASRSSGRTSRRCCWPVPRRFRRPCSPTGSS